MQHGLVGAVVGDAADGKGVARDDDRVRRAAKQVGSGANGVRADEQEVLADGLASRRARNSVVCVCDVSASTASPPLPVVPATVGMIRCGANTR